MDVFWKSLIAGLLTAVVGLVVGKDNKQHFLLLGFAGCTIIAGGIIAYLEPIVQFLFELNSLGNLRTDVLNVLLKSVGIAIIAEFACGICTESGYGSIGKLLQLLGSSIILWLSIPVFRSVLELIQMILGEA